MLLGYHGDVPALGANQGHLFGLRIDRHDFPFYDRYNGTGTFGFHHFMIAFMVGRLCGLHGEGECHGKKAGQYFHCVSLCEVNG